MERLSIIHTFESDSTFLAEVPSVTPRSSAGLTMCKSATVTETRGGRFTGDHEGPASIDSTLDLIPACSGTSEGDRELSVVRIVPVSGSVAFHSRFLVQFEAYCRLSRRLRRAIEWLLLSHQTEQKRVGSSASSLDSSMFDVDCLTRATHPVDPTAFLASAFALPHVVSVSPTPLDEEDMLGPHGELCSADRTRVVPYCFFYSSPEQRLFRGGSVPFSPSERSGMTVLERFAAVAKATGICGIVPPPHNALSIKNRTKVGLTLLAYMEGCLPSCIFTDGNGGPKYGSGVAADFFSQWSDDILWRLLCSLVSALAVVHAGGFHYCGELTPADILCFAIPGENDPGVAAAEALMSGEQEGSSEIPVGQRFHMWAAASERHWAITGATPAHRAFFMLTTPPRSLFAHFPDDPHTVAESQRRDIVAAGSVVLKVVEEMKRRRGQSETGGCVELLFVAQRMVSLEEGGANPSRTDATALAHRFAQLQVVRLRTHLCLLRTVVEERNAQLVAAILYGRSLDGTADSRRNNRRLKDKSDEYSSSGREKATAKPSRGHESSHVRDSSEAPLLVGDVKLPTLAERERALAEREEKLRQFLVLYELTAERLDELPVGSEGFEFLRQMLMQAPSSKSEKTRPKSCSGTRPTSKEGSKERTLTSSSTRSICGTPRPLRDAVRRATPLGERRQQIFSSFTSSKAKDGVLSGITGNGSAGTATSSLIVSGLGGLSKEKRPLRTICRQSVTRTHSSSSHRCGSARPNVSSVVQRVGVKTPTSSRNKTDSPKRANSIERTDESQLKGCFLDIPFARTANRIEASEKLKNTPRTASSPLTKGLGRPLASRSPTRVGATAVTLHRESADRELLRSTQAVRPERQSGDNDTSLPNMAANSLLRLSARARTPQQVRNAATKPSVTNTSSTSAAQGLVPGLALPSNSTSVHPNGKLLHTATEGVSANHEAAAQPKQEAVSCAKTQVKTLTSEETVKQRKQSERVDPPPTNADGSSPGFSPVNNCGGIMTVIDMNDDNQVVMGGGGSSLNSVGRCNVGSPSNTAESSGGRACGAGEFSAAITDRSLSTAASEGARAHNEKRTMFGPQQQPSVRPGYRSDREGPGTPRSLRPRVCDGWVDNHLAALERMRTDFHQSEATKSIRNTPNGKLLTAGLAATHLADQSDSALCANASSGNSADRSTLVNSEN